MELDKEILEWSQEQLAKSKASTAPAWFHSSVVVDVVADIGDGTTVWHFSHIMGGAKIGRECTLGQNVFVAKNVRIGNHCKIQNNVSVYEGVTLCDYVFLGPSCVFTNVKTPRSKYPIDKSKGYERTLVMREVSIGANATIVCGVTIGEAAMVGAGSVVTKDVPSFAIVAGVPAKVVGWACRCGRRLKFGRSILDLWKSERAYCRCGRSYERTMPDVVVQRNNIMGGM